MAHLRIFPNSFDFSTSAGSPAGEDNTGDFAGADSLLTATNDLHQFCDIALANNPGWKPAKTAKVCAGQIEAVLWKKQGAIKAHLQTGGYVVIHPTHINFLRWG